MQIKNKQQIIENAPTQLNRKARTLALNALELALNSADAKKLTRAKVSLKNFILTAEGYSFDLRKLRNVYVVGGGKASGSMAEVLEEMLGKRITDGIVNVPHGDSHETSIIKLNWSGHPVPDEAGVAGTRSILAIAEKAEKDDLIICLISGGGSSLMPLPSDGISLKDKQKLTDGLLKNGARRHEINAVR